MDKEILTLSLKKKMGRNEYWYIYHSGDRMCYSRIDYMKIGFMKWDKRINTEEYHRWKDRKHKYIVKANNVIPR